VLRLPFFASDRTSAMYLGAVHLGLFEIDLGDGVCVDGPNACTVFLGSMGEGTDGMMLSRKIQLSGPGVWIQNCVQKF
jgi:hypothetical protein